MRPPIPIALLALVLVGLVIFSALNRQPETMFVPVSVSVQSQPVQADAAPSAVAGRTSMTLPADYHDTFDLYATIDRPDSITRRFYINSLAVAALRGGGSLPERTQIVVEAYNAARDADGHLIHDADGHLIPADLKPQLHVMELRSDWQTDDVPANVYVGRLNFGSFESSGRRTDEVLSDCFSCHDSANSRGFLFTGNQLQRYVANNEPQYTYCDLPARIPC